MQRLTVGIVGCGLIAQVEHLPNLLALPEHFEVVGIVDPSAKVRAHLSGRYGLDAFAEAGQLFDRNPDCVVIATPDAYHVELTLAALARGIDVFVEKPLCYDPKEAARIAAARDKAGKVVQVGYMKRFDPAFIALTDLLRKQQGDLKSIAVQVLDPDFWPFVGHRDVLLPDDVPPALIAESGRKRAEQAAAALGGSPTPEGLRGFAGPFCSSLVHDVNVVNGALAVLNESLGRPTAAAFHDNAATATAIAGLSGSGALVSLSWRAVPNIAYYTERLTFAYDDAVFELRFPSPYLNHHPTELIERRSSGLEYTETYHRPSYAEGFVEELRAFHASVTGRSAARNTVEEAQADLELLVGLGRLGAGVAS